MQFLFYVLKKKEKREETQSIIHEHFIDNRSCLLEEVSNKSEPLPLEEVQINPYLIETKEIPNYSQKSKSLFDNPYE